MELWERAFFRDKGALGIFGFPDGRVFRSGHKGGMGTVHGYAQLCAVECTASVYPIVAALSAVTRGERLRTGRVVGGNHTYRYRNWGLMFVSGRMLGARSRKAVPWM